MLSNSFSEKDSLANCAIFFVVSLLSSIEDNLNCKNNHIRANKADLLMNGNWEVETRLNPYLHLLSLRHEQRESNRYEWHQADWLFAFG